MTDAQLAWKAAKCAALVLGGLVAFIFVAIGLGALAVAILGKVGAGLLYLAFVFGIFWLCAAMDIQHQEDRTAQGIETAKPTRRETGSARRVKARSAKPMRPKDIA